MSTRITIFATIFLIAFAVAFSLSVYDRLPDQMASHWNTANQVDGYMTRFWGAFLMPVVSAGMLLMFLVIPQIDPLKANIAQFREYFNAFITLIVVFMVYMHVLTMLWNLGYDQFNMGVAMLPAMGLLFVFAGVMMRKAKRNFFIGIRTPWTLSSDRVWDETHRIGATLFIISGILALLGVFFADYAVWFILIPVLASTLFLLVYSYVLYQRETKS
ncbi:MAG: SdpI family protein [Anaerolineales bacterium]|nr:SdpI family protein [Anaerolineales bacterium]